MKLNGKNIKKGIDILINSGPSGLINRNNYPLSPIEQLNDVSFEIGDISIVIEKSVNILQVVEELKKLKQKYQLFVLDSNIEGYSYLNSYTFENVFKFRSFIYLYTKEKCNFDMSFNVSINCNLIKNINNLLNSLSGLKLLANYDNKFNISVKTSTFYDYEGYNYYSGGAERYLLDLYEICKEVGFNLNIYQHATIPFFRKYHNINVIGLCPKQRKVENNYIFTDEQTKNYIYHTFNNTKLHIYSSFQECYPNHIGPSIGISHGISWDSKMNVYAYGMNNFCEDKKKYIIGAIFCTKLISVDTNTPNWFQTIDYELGNKKMKTISNYVDTEEFKKDEKRKSDKIIITYPRRLYEPRGMYLLLDIVDDLFEKYSNIEIHFVGKGFENDTIAIEQKRSKYPEQLFCYNKPPQEMHKVYKNSDISLIPTLYSEGTSLSCLEAMATSNIVIATRIGGLTDLVIDGLNGYVIEPTKEDLFKKLQYVIENFEKQDKIRALARETAQAFNKNKWKEKWKDILSSFELQGSSSNIGLVEFYLEDITTASKKIQDKIKEELQKNQLIYIRSRKALEYDNISNQLLQVINYDDVVTNVADKVYIDKNIKEKIVRTENCFKI